MSKKKLLETVQELMELRNMAAELADEITTLEDQLKAHMDKAGMDVLEAGKHTVRYTPVYAVRFDAKAFQAENPALYAGYTKPTEYKRFTVV